jgi:hypothetical protein
VVHERSAVNNVDADEIQRLWEKNRTNKTYKYIPNVNSKEQNGDVSVEASKQDNKHYKEDNLALK